MFEKEAEDSFNSKKVLYKSSTDKRSYTDGFKDGYNKAKEEMQELLKEGVQLLKNSDELYGYQIKDFYLKCKPFIKED